MKESSRNLLVGLTAIAGCLAMTYLVFVFGELPRWLEDNYAITVELDTAEGVAAGTRVRLAGVDVGVVERVSLKEDPRQGVSLQCQIARAYSIPSGSTVNTASGLLGGGGALLITPPPPTSETSGALARDGTGLLKGRVTSMATQLAKMTDSLGGDLRAQMQNFGEASKKVAQLAEEFTAVGQKLNVMLAQRSPDDVDAGTADANLVTVFARADARLAELKTTLAKINELVGDEQTIADLKATIANAKDATAGAKELTADGRKAIAEVTGQFDQLTRRYVAVADDLSKSLTRLDGLLAGAERGEGTVGKLFKDPAMYDSFTDAAKRLDDSLKEFKLLIQKWKAEGLPVQF